MNTMNTTLEHHYYHQPDVYAFECEQVFRHHWWLVATEAEFAAGGDYRALQLMRWPIVLVRDHQGELRGFYNLCRHRAGPLVDEGCGQRRDFVCRYHGWRYALDGSLAEIPDRDLFCPAVTESERSLKPVRLALWAGMVWLNMDPTAEPLTDFLGTIIDNLAPYHFENMVLAKHQTVALDANWKTVRDNFLEQYHVDFIHPQHASLVDCCNSTNILWPFGHSATMVQGYVTNSRYPLPQQTPEHLVPLLRGLGLDPDDFDGRVADIRAAVQQQKRKIGAQLGFDYADLDDEQVSDIWQYDIFPNTFMTIQAEELWIYGPRPHPSDPNKCLFDKWTLQIPMEIACDEAQKLTLNPRLMVSRDDDRPQHDVFSQADVIAGKHSLTITLDQDIYYLADMQAGMHSRGFDCAVLNEEEVRVQHFHDWVDDYLAQHVV